MARMVALYFPFYESRRTLFGVYIYIVYVYTYMYTYMYIVLISHKIVLELGYIHESILKIINIQ